MPQQSSYTNRLLFWVRKARHHKERIGWRTTDSDQVGSRPNIVDVGSGGQEKRYKLESEIGRSLKPKQG